MGKVLDNTEASDFPTILDQFVNAIENSDIEIQIAFVEVLDYGSKSVHFEKYLGHLVIIDYFGDNATYTLTLESAL